MSMNWANARDTIPLQLSKVVGLAPTRATWFDVVVCTSTCESYKARKQNPARDAQDRGTLLHYFGKASHVPLLAPPSTLLRGTCPNMVKASGNTVRVEQVAAAY
ncbi:hypothetical protein TRVL_02107 [Trypanosoma vivax]|nr:hypothetical protein TRVL_02107 [Trypanosoma vivax]